MMIHFLELNEMLWDNKFRNYRRPDLKITAWQKQAETMSKTVESLQGWFKGLRDNIARLDKLPDPDPANGFSRREGSGQ